MVSRITGIFKRKSDDLNCKDVRELSSDYIDGEMDEVIATGVHRHLAWCAPCSAFVSTLKATVDLLRSTPKREAPDGFQDRIRENLRKDKG